MARPLRIEYAGALYHLTARGNERKRIYFTKTDYGKFREYIARSAGVNDMIIGSYERGIEDSVRRLGIM